MAVKLWLFFTRATNRSPGRRVIARIVLGSPKPRSHTERIGRAPARSTSCFMSSGTSGLSLPMPSSDSLIASASPVRASSATSARAPIKAPVYPRAGASRWAASLIFLPSPITTSNASKQLANLAGDCGIGPSGISALSLAAPSRNSARLTAWGMFASLR